MSADRSFVYSILKCDYGWNGCTPSGCDHNEWEKLIAQASCSMCVAKTIARDIFNNGGVFRPRIDGRPNNRSVVTDENVIPIERYRLRAL